MVRTVDVGEGFREPAELAKEQRKKDLKRADLKTEGTLVQAKKRGWGE